MAFSFQYAVRWKLNQLSFRDAQQHDTFHAVSTHRPCISLESSCCSLVRCAIIAFVRAFLLVVSSCPISWQMLGKSSFGNVTCPQCDFSFFKNIVSPSLQKHIQNDQLFKYIRPNTLCKPQHWSASSDLCSERKVTIFVLRSEMREPAYICMVQCWCMFTAQVFTQTFQKHLLFPDLRFM